MRVLVFSDLHMHDYKQFAQYDADGLNSRLLHCYSVFEQLATYYKAYKCDATLFCGDMFHKKSYLFVPVLNLAVKGVKLLSDLGPFICIAGNHDLHTKGITGHSLDALSEIPGVQILENSFAKNGMPVYGHMFGTPLDTTIKSDIFLGHGFVQGAKLPSGIEVSEGYSVQQLKQQFQFSFIGDIHLPQQWLGLVFIPGSPLMHDFGDVGQTKHVILLDTDTNKKQNVTYLPVNAPEFRSVLYQQPSDLRDAQQDNFNYYRVTCQKPILAAELEELKSVYVNSIILAPSGIEGEKTVRMQVEATDTDKSLLERYLSTNYADIAPETKQKVVELCLEALT